jgi:hypothetical protein
MHPDSATLAIIDTSLRLGVPFAILPCCFSHKLFPDERRKLVQASDEDRVKHVASNPFQSYSIFCQYLLEKAPVGLQFQVENLSFQGRNKVIYFSSYSCTEISMQ